MGCGQGWGETGEMARMKVRAYIESVRETYVEALRRAIRKSKEEGTFLASEVVIRTAREGADAGAASPEGGAEGEGGEGGGFLLADLLTGTPEAPQPAILMRDPEEGPMIGAIGQGMIEVAVYPFLWEACRVWLRHAEPDWSNLQGWFRVWFEEKLGSERGGTGEDGLMGMVHLMSDPIPEGGGYLFNVDFGSAPVEAFFNLLEALSGMGASDVRIGQSDGTDLDEEVVEALRSPELTQETFLKLVSQLVSELEGVAGVEVMHGPPAMFLRVREEGVQEASVLNLMNLWLVLQRTSLEHRPREVARYLRGQLESTQYQRLHSPPDLSSLRPVIKSSEFVEHVRQLAQNKGDQRLSLLCTRFVGDLWIACVWDRPNGMQFVTSGEPEEFGLSREEAHARALKNYLGTRGEVETVVDRGVIVARTHDNYDASLLLDDDFWSEMARKMPGEVLACAPTRDAVLISSVGTDGGEAKLRQLAQEYLAAGNHAISGTMLRRQANVWVVHLPSKGARAVGDVEALRKEENMRVKEEVEKKKPWWKFW